jgi:predicted transglutaminase-like cysteine proteinase
MRFPLHIVVLVAALGTSACATTVQSLTPPAPSTPMVAGVPDRDPPPGFVSFCLRFADQCTSGAMEATTITLDAKNWALANTVNVEWNQKIWPEHDKAHFDRTEYWTIPTDGYGDCKDYALAKRMQLAELGIPRKALRIAIVMTPHNERHAVLTLATDKGDYVLDNLTDSILPWSATGYKWIARQDPRDDWGWVVFGGASTELASSHSSSIFLDD